MTSAQIAAIKHGTIFVNHDGGQMDPIRLDELAEAFFDGLLGGNVVLPATPLTGATITAPDTGNDVMLDLAPAGTIAALTVVIPTNANSHNGQRLVVFSTQIVTTLTLTLGGQTVTNAPTTIAANGSFELVKAAPNLWRKVR